MEHVDILIVGGGAAGIGAAKAAWAAGCRSILVADRGNRLGGILLQCAHRGFGSGLTGGEFAAELLSDFPEGIALAAETDVLSASPEKWAVLSSRAGLRQVGFDQLILASGCMEIPMGALPIGGTRPKGVYTAGQMQAMMNLEGLAPEGPVVILGSGDLGLIMANQIADAGIPVTLVEKGAACGGMARNQKKAAAGEIPLLCGRTVTEVRGYPELAGVVLSDGEELPCRTLLTAVGLRPDRELIRELGSPDWLHICGNANRVHPMVEAVAAEGKQAGVLAWEKVRDAR